MTNLLPKYDIDPEFRRMIYPLSKRDYRQLERDIITNGCVDPISIWNGLIIDGHNRYEICQKQKICFETAELRFADRNDAILWLCNNQLNRKNTSEEIRRYLIGKQYLIEKSTAELATDNRRLRKKPKTIHVSPIAITLSSIYHVSPYTIGKYGSFAKAIDYVSEYFPSQGQEIAYGNIRISHNNLMDISKKSIDEIKLELDLLMNIRKRNVNKKPREYDIDNTIGAIKNMPQFDPDSYAMSLALTIPSWIKTMAKTKNNTDMSIISPKARVQLFNSLNDIKEAATELMNLLEVR